MTRRQSLLRRISREEAGTTIIEVLASAVVLALVSIGVLAGIDGAQRQSNQNRLRAVASSVAQADQERLRGLRARQLYNRDETRTVNVHGATFSVRSTAAWLLDSGTEFPCSGQGNYMRINSAVTLPGSGIRVTNITSLLTPSGQAGTVSATITRANLTGISGIAVTMTGAQTQTVTTDARGCVLFGQLTPGTYTLTFSKPGYVDTNGVNAVSKTVTVNAESTVSETFRYDLPGTIIANFKTKRGSAPEITAQSGWVPPSSGSASLSHTGLQQGTRPYTLAPAATSATMNNLFPFTDAYSVYAGNCSGANPASYTTAPTLAPFAVPNNQIVTPGGSHTVSVRVPALRFRYRARQSTTGTTTSDYWVGLPGKQQASTTTPLTVVKLTATAPGCGGQTSWSLDDTIWTNNADTGGFIDRPTGRAASEDWGIPIGTYDICIDIPTGFNPQGVQGAGHYYASASNVPVKDPNGETVSLELVNTSCT